MMRSLCVAAAARSVLTMPARPPRPKPPASDGQGVRCFDRRDRDDATIGNRSRRDDYDTTVGVVPVVFPCPDSAPHGRLPRLNGTTAERSRARSAAAI